MALLGGSVGVALHSLDHPWVKQRVKEAVQKAAGVAIDYRVVRLDLFSSATIEGLVVQSPEEVRGFAPKLLTVGQIEVRWKLGTLLGRLHAVERIAISDVALSVVQNETGRTSFDALPSTGSEPTAPPVPLSSQVSSLLGNPLPASEIALNRVTLTLVRTDHGTVSDTLSLRGLSALVTLGPAASESGWGAKLALGEREKPLDLTVVRRVGEAETGAAGHLWLATDATSSRVRTTLDLQIKEQSFAPDVSASHWLRSEATLLFDPRGHKSTLTLENLEAGDGAVAARGSVEIPDHGDPVLVHAEGNADLARLLKWVPRGLIPLTADRALVHYRVDSLVLASIPHLSEGGSAAADAALSNVILDVADGQSRIGEAKLTLEATPVEHGGMAARGAVTLGAVALTSAKMRAGADDVHVDFDGRRAGGGEVDGRVGLRFGELEADAGSRARGRDGHLELKVHGLKPGGKDPHATEGDIIFSAEVASLNTESPGGKALAEKLALRAHTHLLGHPPSALELDLGAARLRVVGRDGRLLTDSGAHLKAAATELFVDSSTPKESRGEFELSCEAGGVNATAKVRKGADKLAFDVRAAASSLGILRPFLPPDLLARASWGQIGATLASSGEITHLHASAPNIEQKSSLDISRLAAAGVTARAIGLRLQSKGTAWVHDANLDVRTEALSALGEPAADDHVTLSATVDRPQRTLRFAVTTEGRGKTKLAGSLSFDKARHALPFEIAGELSQLANLAPLLSHLQGFDAVDLTKLDGAASFKGELLGVVNAVGDDGAIVLEPHPSVTAAVVGDADAHATNLHWSRGDTEWNTPTASWRGLFRLEGAKRTVLSHVEIGALHLDLGPKNADLAGLRDDSVFTVSGDLRNPDVSVATHSTVRDVEQDLAPEYPISLVTLDLNAERDREGLTHVSELKFDNAGGGTSLSLSGNFDLEGDRQMLSVTGTVGQDLGRLTRAPERFAGRGKLAIDATVTSPDLSLFRVRSAVRAEKVSLKLPRAGVELDDATGEVPIAVTLERSKSTVSLRPEQSRSAYSMLRFTDQHPLLSHSGIVSIARLQTPFATVAPLVGNLAIDQNVISLRQFEVGVRGGSITGLCSLVWAGAKSSLELHVRATGVQSSHGEPFDGNIAVMISAGDRTVDGRAEVLRIGERHLLDLMDMADPTRTDPAMNRIRSTLKFGYPDKLRLVFDHGFVSAKLEMGGLARLASIDEIRGIPMGPIVDKLLAPPTDSKEAP